MNGLVISSHTLLCVWSIIQVGIIPYDYNHYQYYYYYHHYCCRSCCYQYYHHHHHHHHRVIVIITIIIIILGIFNHQCVWTYYYKIRWDFAMMWQIAAFKYIFNWYLHPGIYSSMEYSITRRHKLCRAFTLDALASRPVACTLLTHWGRVTHICVSKLTIIGSNNSLSPVRRQAIIWTNAGILLIGPLGTNFNET